MRHLESALQKQVIGYIRLQYPHTLSFAVPNGGKRGKVEASIMKAEGVLAGVSDILLFWHGGMGAIELKIGKNTESDYQKAFGARWLEIGGHYAVCRSLDDVISVMRAWGIPKAHQVTSTASSGNQ